MKWAKQKQSNKPKNPHKLHMHTHTHTPSGNSWERQWNDFSYWEQPGVKARSACEAWVNYSTGSWGQAYKIPTREHTLLSIII